MQTSSNEGICKLQMQMQTSSNEGIYVEYRMLKTIYKLQNF